MGCNNFLFSVPFGIPFVDFAYVIILVGSLVFGVVLSLIDGRLKRQMFSSAIGILLVVILCDWNALHSLLVTGVNCLIISVLPKRSCHICSFVFSFGYLVFFEMATQFGLPMPSTHHKTLQQFITLKLVGLAFEVHDNDNSKECSRDVNRNEEERKPIRLGDGHNKVSPSCLDIFCYSYCFLGLFTGPYYKYKIYEDMLENQHSLKPWKSVAPMRTKILQALTFYCSYLALSTWFNLQYAMSEEFYEDRSALYRVFYMFPLFTIYRFRLYAAFISSECACILAGLGGYPKSSRPRPGNGPTKIEVVEESDSDNTCDTEFDFSTVECFDILEVETAPSMRQFVRTWNRTVQYWLANNVYMRLTRCSVFAKIVITMIVSALWHGVHPGYYMTALTASVYLTAEDLLVGRKFTDERPSWSRWFSAFFRMRMCEYHAVGFLFLGFHGTIRYWSSIYYYGHVLIVSSIFVALFEKIKNTNIKYKVQ